MKTTYYAMEPGAPGVPLASATGLYALALKRVLERRKEELGLRIRWLRPAQVPEGAGGLTRLRTGFAWVRSEMNALLSDPARNVVMMYPKTPVLSHVGAAWLLRASIPAYRRYVKRVRRTGQRLVLVMEDLPIEMVHGRHAAGGPPPDLPIRPQRTIEGLLLRAAQLVVTPPGYAPRIRELYGISEERFRLFRHNLYLPPEDVRPPDTQFRKGGVLNVFYAGALRETARDNLVQVARVVASTEGAHLHICGPRGDLAHEWLAAEAPDAYTHYGLLDPGEHDWLASRCDVGLILWPTNDPYYHLSPTSKYSSYVANGLAVVAPELKAISDNLRDDGTGLTASEEGGFGEALKELADDRGRLEGMKAAARALGPALRNGDEMMPWIEELTRE